MRPNIFLGVSEGSAQYKKWYYELMVDHTEPFVTAEATHLRVGWASTEGYSPYPGGGEEWGGNGVGDDLFSYGFDGLHLWSGTCCPFSFTMFQKEIFCWAFLKAIGAASIGYFYRVLIIQKFSIERMSKSVGEKAVFH